MAIDMFAAVDEDDVEQDQETVWYLYRVYGAARVLLYVGQTGRMALVRWLEHIRKKDWAGDIIAIEREERTYPSEASAKAAEKLAIKTEWPLHNVEHNEGNPNRIVPPARASRPRRRSAGRRTGSAPHRPAVRVPRPPARRRVRRRRSRRRLSPVGLFALWFVAGSALRVAVDGRMPDHPAWLLAGCVPAIAMILACFGRTRRRRR